MQVRTYAKHNPPRTIQDRNMVKTQKYKGMANILPEILPCGRSLHGSRQDIWKKTIRGEDPGITSDACRDSRKNRWEMSYGRSDIMQKLKNGNSPNATSDSPNKQREAKKYM